VNVKGVSVWSWAAKVSV